MINNTPTSSDEKDTIYVDLPTGQILSIRGVINLSGLGRTKIYSEIREGRLPCVKVGTRTLLTREQYVAWQKALPLAELKSGRTGSRNV